MKDSFQDIFEGKNRILIVFAHPDDAEIYCGGTIARLAAEKKVVRVVKVSSGNKGSRQETISETDLKTTREKEDESSMRTLGVKKEDNIYLTLGDGEISNDLVTIGLLAKQIREFKPDIVITHNPEDVIIRFDKGVNWVNHRDHRNTGKSVVDAAYPYSRDILFFPEHFKDSQLSSHIVSEFLFVDYYGHQDEVFIDVTDHVETRVKAIACHNSQYSIEDAEDSTEFFTVQKDSDRRWERFRYVVAD